MVVVCVVVMCEVVVVVVYGDVYCGGGVFVVVCVFMYGL